MKKIGARVITAFLIFTLCLGLVSAAGRLKVQAANFQFITGIRLAYGESAYEELEEAGFRVMSVGLNYSVEDSAQIYLGYRINEGSPVTNIVIASNVGESFVSSDGIQYQSAGDIDVDLGTGTSTGIIYYTTDPAAGEPLVGLDILRQDITEGRELLAIQNDGSEIARNTEGMPVDLEAGNAGIIIYLAQIRDHIVRPYIRDIVTFTDMDRQSAVFKAAEEGYNYFIDGDIDDNSSTYTIVAYERTASRDEAITNIIGVSEELRSILEEKQIKPGSEEETEVPETAEAPTETQAEEPETTEPEPETTEPETIEPETEAATETSEPGPTELEEAETSEVSEAEETTGEGMSEETSEPETTEAPDETQGAVPETEAAPETEIAPETEAAPETEIAPETETAPETEETTEPEPTEAPVETQVAEPETEPEVHLTADALDISGVEYICVNNEPIPGNTPWNLYITHNSKAGNPVSMLYAETAEESKRIFFGMWADGFFAAKGSTRAYTYVVNEDLLAELQEDRTVYAELPVMLFGGSWDETADEVKVEIQERALALSLLTQNDGLPEERLEMNGVKEIEEEAPAIEREENDSSKSGITSTAFEDRESKFLIIGLVIGVVLIVSAAVVVLVRKKKIKDAAKKKGNKNS